jgi:cyclophilin family peptidyl-prolyl cis-trans isomerase
MSIIRLLRTASALVFAASLLSAQTPDAPKPAAAKTEPAKPSREPGLYATIVTSQGTIVAKLFEKEAPITVKNFVGLATGTKPWPDPKTGQPVKRPLYSGLTFHRVIPGFMIQGGDPLGTGTGGTDPIKDEFHPEMQFDRPGRFGMANAGPGTGSSQFFITEVPTPHLNGRHTVFGQVVEGQDVVEKIARVPRGANDRPTTPVRMVRVTIKREGAGPVSAKPAVAKPKSTAPKPAVGKPATTTAKPKPAASKPKPATPPAK